MSQKREQAKARARVMSVLRELGIDPKSKIDWGFSSPEHATVRLARLGDRVFYVPEVCEMFTFGKGWELSVRVKVIDERPHFVGISLRAHKPLQPLDVQRIAWSQIAEGALLASAVEEDAAGTRRRATGADVSIARARARRRSQVPTGKGERTAVDDEKLRRVLELRAEAQSKGVRWDTYAAKELHYSTAYLRRLAGRADRERKGKR